MDVSTHFAVTPLPTKSPPRRIIETITSKTPAAGPKGEFKRASSALPTLAEIEAVLRLANE